MRPTTNTGSLKKHSRQLRFCALLPCNRHRMLDERCSISKPGVAGQRLVHCRAAELLSGPAFARPNIRGAVVQCRARGVARASVWLR
jgi:hypothetical protein